MQYNKAILRGRVSVHQTDEVEKPFGITRLLFQSPHCAHDAHQVLSSQLNRVKLWLWLSKSSFCQLARTLQVSTHLPKSSHLINSHRKSGVPNVPSAVLHHVGQEAKLKAMIDQEGVPHELSRKSFNSFTDTSFFCLYSQSSSMFFLIVVFVSLIFSNIGLSAT